MRVRCAFLFASHTVGGNPVGGPSLQSQPEGGRNFSSQPTELPDATAHASHPPKVSIKHICALLGTGVAVLWAASGAFGLDVEL
jgi:hypothetical protein